MHPPQVECQKAALYLLGICARAHWWQQRTIRLSEAIRKAANVFLCYLFFPAGPQGLGEPRSFFIFTNTPTPHPSQSVRRGWVRLCHRLSACQRRILLFQSVKHFPSLLSESVSGGGRFRCIFIFARLVFSPFYLLFLVWLQENLELCFVFCLPVLIN